MLERYGACIRQARLLPVAAVLVAAITVLGLGLGFGRHRPARAGPAPSPAHRGGRSTPAAAPTAIPPAAVPVQIGATPDSRPVPPGFLGLSIEYRSAPGYFGPPAAPDGVFLRLVRNLNPGQSPVLRFGGDTTDWTWAPTPGVPKPPGIQYALSPRWLQSTHAAARALDARIIAGVNFESDSPRVAAAESAALIRGIGRPYLAGLELGNEPEVYGSLGWYETPAGVSVPGRPASYDFAAYLRDYARVSRAIPDGVPLVGPASGAERWLAGLGQYLAANPRVRVVTFHRYPLHRCFTAPTSPAFPSIANLLAPAAAAGPATSLASAIAVAHAHGVPLRADELNSVSCGGARGVSDTLASALWILDTLFNLARVGADGVNIHTFHNGIYEPFAIAQHGGRWTAEVRPLYYGLLMFAQAAPPGARLLPASFRAPSTLRIWATRGPGGRVRVVLINDSRRQAVTVAVRPPTPSVGATGTRLRAPHADATSDVTLGGQSFATPTRTGLLAGPARTFRLRPIRGRLVVRLPPASATLVSVGPQTGGGGS